MTRIATVSACVLLLAPAPTSAQQAPDSAGRGSPVAAPLRFAPADRLVTARPAPQEPSGRYTRRGFIIGGIAGAAVGLGIGTFIALFCETESDGCPAAIPAVTLLGAASGAVGGAIIGAAIPRRDAPAPEPAAAPARRRIGSAAVAAGWADLQIQDEIPGSRSGSGGLATRLSLLAELGPRFAIGPELGYGTFDGAGDAQHAAVLVRGSWPAGAVAPYASFHIGAYQTTANSLEFLGGGPGLGVRVTPGRAGNVVIDAEGRWSRHLQNIEPMRMRTVSLGVGVRW